MLTNFFKWSQNTALHQSTKLYFKIDTAVSKNYPTMTSSAQIGRKKITSFLFLNEQGVKSAWINMKFKSL